MKRLLRFLTLILCVFGLFVTKTHLYAYTCGQGPDLCAFWPKVGGSGQIFCESQGCGCPTNPVNCNGYEGCTGEGCEAMLRSGDYTRCADSATTCEIKCDPNKCKSACACPGDWRDTQPAGEYCTTGKTCTNECNKPLGCGTCYKSHECDCNQGCDPGYYEQYTGPLCKGDETCSCDSECTLAGQLGKRIYPKKICYAPETNQTPQTPTSIRIYERLNVDNFEWTTYTPLSTDRATLIRYPYPTSTMRTETNNPGLPDGARDIRVTLSIGGTPVGPPRVRSVDNPFYVFNTFPNMAWLTSGYYGRYSSFFETLDKCNDWWKKGGTHTVDFKVNTPPIITSTNVIGDTEKTTKGCKPEDRYTGNEANRTLKFTIAARDPDIHYAGPNDDANHRMTAAVLWLVKEGQTIDNEKNTVVATGPGQTTTNHEKIGIMVNTAGAIYKSNNGSGTFTGWGRDNGNPGIYYTDTNGQRKKLGTISIGNIKHAVPRIPNNDTTEMEIIIQFEKNIPLSGRYQIWTGMMDNLTLFPTQPHGYFADIRSVKNTGQIWNFDFRNPRLTAINLDRLATGDQKNLKLSWTSTDSGHPESEVVHTVINVSSSSDKEVTRTFPDPENPVPIIPGNLSEAEMGNLSPLRHGWKHPVNSNGFETYMIANTGDTASGTLRFDVTLYDKACNFGGTGRPDDCPTGDPDCPDPLPDDPDPFNYDRWMSTKGGIFYSQGTVDYRTKLLEPNIHFYNLGSELLATKANGIDPIREVLMFGGTEQHRNPAVAKGVEDTNEQNKVNLYEALKREANSSMDKKLLRLTPPSDPFTEFTWACTSEAGCYVKLEPNNTIKIGGIVYSGKILIYSQGNITITGALQATSNNDAMFVFSEKNIIVNDGHATGGTDRIDAFLLARDRVIIAQDAAVSENHDQVLLVGGLIAFGIGGESPSFVLQRNLGADNPLRPALIINYHPKYTKFAENFFDVDKSIYKKEVGFKPL